MLYSHESIWAQEANLSLCARSKCVYAHKWEKFKGHCLEYTTYHEIRLKFFESFSHHCKKIYELQL